MDVSAQRSRIGGVLQALPEGSRAVGTFKKKRDLFLTHERGEDQGGRKEM